MLIHRQALWIHALSELANLNAGMGEPCAGQRRLSGLRTRRSIPDVFVSDENFGAEPPTGSESVIKAENR